MERHLIGAPARRLAQLGSPGRIGIKISGRFAGSRDGQRLLWAVCNLACRLKGVVSGVEVCAPAGTEVAEPDLVVPGPWSGSLSGSLRGTLNARARGCGVSVVHGDLGAGLPMAILLGAGASTESGPAAEIHATCNGWLADCWHGEEPLGVLRAGGGGGGNPFGAAAAACIAVGEAFKRLGGPRARPPWNSTRFSMYDLRTHDMEGSAPENPPLPKRVDIRNVCVCGCGAVGNAFCQWIGMIPGVRGDLHLVDRLRGDRQNDELVDDTNLARYVMCTNGDIGRPKAETLAERMGGCGGLSVSHTDGDIKSLARGGPGRIEYAVSCLDNDPARRELQDLLPRRILGGSAYDLQSQVSVYDTARGTQCLKCYNRGGIAPPPGAAAAAGRGPEGGAAGGGAGPCPPVPECGSLDGKTRSRLDLPDNVEFSANFVTAFSGAVLAAEIAKATFGRRRLAPALDCRSATDMFYSFWSGGSRLTTTKPRAGCWCGGPGLHRAGAGRRGAPGQLPRAAPDEAGGGAAAASHGLQVAAPRRPAREALWAGTEGPHGPGAAASGPDRCMAGAWNLHAGASIGVALAGARGESAAVPPRRRPRPRRRGGQSGAARRGGDKPAEPDAATGRGPRAAAAAATEHPAARARATGEDNARRLFSGVARQ